MASRSVSTAAAPSTSGSLALRLLPPLLAHLVVALVALVAIGGATRVMEAGLACPDWPLCYGSLLPGRQMNLQVFLEWFHRLDAFLVGLTLLVVQLVSLLQRRCLPPWLPWAAALLLALVCLQGALGALTVLGLLASGTVTAHLLTGLLLVLLVSASCQALHSVGIEPERRLPAWWWPLPLAASLLLFLQCFLGGSMASRWASSLCLSSGADCHWLLLHRLGAWGALAALLLLGIGSIPLVRVDRLLSGLAITSALLAPLQVLLGIASLRLRLSEPLLTVSHQIVAALLVALLGAIWGRALIHLSAARAIPPSHSLEVVHG